MNPKRVSLNIFQGSPLSRFLFCTPAVVDGAGVSRENDVTTRATGDFGETEGCGNPEYTRVDRWQCISILAISAPSIIAYFMIIGWI